MPWGGNVRVQQPRHRDAAGHRQPGDRVERRRGVGEPPGHVQASTTSTRNSTRSIPYLPLGQPDARDGFLQVRPLGPGRRARATTRAATPTTTGPTTASRPCRRRTSLNTFNWMGMIKLPAQARPRTPASPPGSNRQDDELDRVDDQPGDRERRPCTPRSRSSASLPRDTPTCDVNYTTATMNISSRPLKDITLVARYRFNGRNDFTAAVRRRRVRPGWTPCPRRRAGSPSRSASTGTPSTSAPSSRRSPKSAIRSATEDKLEHTIRVTRGYKDKTMRVSFDTVGNQYVTLRAMYEHTDRETIDLRPARPRGDGHAAGGTLLRRGGPQARPRHASWSMSRRPTRSASTSPTATARTTTRRAIPPRSSACSTTRTRRTPWV